MKPDTTLIIRHFPERDNLCIFPIADLHIGAAEFRTDLWVQFTKRVLDSPNTYLTLGGDMINNTTRSSVANIFEETMRPREQKALLVEYLEPLRDRILCAVSGNHERRSEKDADDNPMYDVMCKLDIEDRYRENFAIVKLRIGNTKGDGIHNPTYTFAVTHGAGGGIYTGAAVNRNERFGYIIDGIDALIVGHSHKPAITKPVKIKVDTHNNTVKQAPFVVITSTSWLDYGGYAAQKMLLPSSVGNPQALLLTGTEKRIEVLW